MHGHLVVPVPGAEGRLTSADKTNRLERARVAQIKKVVENFEGSNEHKAPITARMRTRINQIVSLRK